MASLRFSRSAVRLSSLPAAALLALAGPACAAEVITITGTAPLASANITGFGDIPLAKVPFQTQVLGNSQLQDAGIFSLGDITRLDASISDAYNSPGYAASMQVRGYALDNRYNYRRDGLPISGETALLLDNKEQLEVLKGTSGLQAGTSAPGGLVNLVVKRPRGNQRSLTLGWSEAGSLKAAADVDQRLGADGALGLRINAAAERLQPPQHAADGQRHLLAAAASAQLGAGRLLEAEFELSHQSQPSVPGFSMLGDTLPLASQIDPRTNLNNQTWSLPVVFDGTTASLRWTEPLGADWKLISQAQIQQLRTDDRIAFPSGLYDPVTYDCNPCDRYGADGSFSLWDFRSDNEHRDSRALALSLEGTLRTGGLQHRLSTGLSWSDYRARLGAQTYNLTGVGQIDGSVQLPASPDPFETNTNRTERSTELHLRDAVTLSPGTLLWLGLRHSRLARESVRTDGSRATRYDQGYTTPWLALSQQLSSSLLAYASWGQGVESDVAPNRARYSNAGQALPALKSRQFEAGLKQQGQAGGWSVAAFDIRRPVAADIGSCDGDNSCSRQIDGAARHIGVEGSADARWARWTVSGSAQWLQARRENSRNSALNGLTPENVAERSLRLSASYRADLPALPGLLLQAGVSHEGGRPVLPDNSVQLPGWTRWSASGQLPLQLAGQELLLRAGVENLFDQRAWQESPYQYGHVYLYPMAPRTFRISLQAFL